MVGREPRLCPCPTLHMASYACRAAAHLLRKLDGVDHNVISQNIELLLVLTLDIHHPVHAIKVLHASVRHGVGNHLFYYNFLLCTGKS